MTWGAASAKAKFSAVLDEAETQGPQLVKRRKTNFFVVTEQQWNDRALPATKVAEPFVSIWDSLRVEAEFQTDEDLFPRHHDVGRTFEF